MFASWYLSVEVKDEGWNRQKPTLLLLNHSFVSKGKCLEMWGKTLSVLCQGSYILPAQVGRTWFISKIETREKEGRCTPWYENGSSFYTDCIIDKLWLQRKDLHSYFLTMFTQSACKNADIQWILKILFWCKFSKVSFIQTNWIYWFPVAKLAVEGWILYFPSWNHPGRHGQVFRLRDPWGQF